MIKSHLAAIIEKALNKYITDNNIQMEAQLPNIEIEYATDYKFGDYACAIAMRLSKLLKKNPFDIATDIVKLVQDSNDNANFKTVEVARPGFINMRLSDSYISDEIQDVLTIAEYKKNIVANPMNIQIEYVSANPTGPLHIGHGRWAAIGDSLSRLLTYIGHTVYREFYVNDAGVQIENLNASIAAVAEGKPIPEKGYHGGYVADVAKIAKETGREPKDILLDEQKELLKKFRCEFDNFASEAAVRDAGGIESVLEFFAEKGASFEEDGALWFKSTDFGDDKDRVLKKSDGNYTYFASDCAYHKTKVDKKFDALVDILGADHHGYVSRITSAVTMLSGGKTSLHVILGQLVRLFRGEEAVKMSKRTGDIISLEEVIEEIGIDPTRYFLVMRSATTTLDFDLEVAKKQDNDNPVYYVQYAYARVCNILLKLKEKGMSFDENAAFNISKIETADDENTQKLAKMIIRFADEMLICGKTYEVHPLVTYMYELASCFHRFYYNNIVLDQDDNIRTQRLLLALATKKILGICFDIIGITKIESMYVDEAN